MTTIVISNSYTVSFPPQVQYIVVDYNASSPIPIIVTIPPAPSDGYFVSIQTLLNVYSSEMEVILSAGGSFVLQPFQNNTSYRALEYSTEFNTWIPLMSATDGLKPYLFLTPVPGFDVIEFPKVFHDVSTLTVSFYDPLFQMSFLGDYSTYTLTAGNPTLFYTDFPNFNTTDVMVSGTIDSLNTQYSLINNLNGIQTFTSDGSILSLDFDSSFAGPSFTATCRIYNNGARFYIPLQFKCLDSVQYLLQ